jgi:hypothetical protein
LARAAKALSAFAAVALVVLIAPAGAGAIATLSPTYYDFGPTALKSTKTIRFELSTSCPDDPNQLLLQCQQPEEGPLPVFIQISGSFTQTNNCPATMPRVETVSTCSIWVTFPPAALGPSQGRLSTGSPANGAPSSLLAGTGTPAVNQPAKKKCRKVAKRASASAKAKAKAKKCLRRKGKS